MTDVEKSIHTEELRVPGRLVLPALFLARFATQNPSTITSLLLIDIGLTFGYSVGVTSQLRAMFSLFAAISAVLMGAWSVRFNHKSLLLLGLLFIIISVVGSAFAFNFHLLLIIYSL